MYIDDFIWLPDIAEKIAVKHRVTEEETEEVFFNRPYYRQTDAGRYLIVFFIYKPANIALILTARDMDKKERNRYEQR